MKTKKELHIRLEKLLKKYKEDLIQCKIDLKKAKKERLEAEEYLKKVKDYQKQLSINYFGCDIDKVEDNIIIDTYKIINS